MGSWAIPIYIALGIVAATGLFFWWEWLTVKSCPVCFYPIRRCECNHCPHTNQSEIKWTQDGWVAKCHDCTELLYYGDRYDDGRD